MLQHNYALVTGGSRGVGKEVCKQLLQHGKPVVFTSTDADAGQRVVSELKRHTSDVPVHCLPLDQASPSSIQQLVETVQRNEYEVDLLINNAGIMLRHAWDQPTYDTTLAVNIAGPIAVTQALLPHLADGALIIMVSSGMAGLFCLSDDYRAAVTSQQDWHTLASAIPFNLASPMSSLPPQSPGSLAPTYCVAKALMNRAVELMAADEQLKARRMRVVSVTPGWCRTDLGTQAAERSAEEGASSVLAPYFNWSDSFQGSFTRDGLLLSPFDSQPLPMAAAPATT